MADKKEPKINPAGLRGPEWQWADEQSLQTSGVLGKGEDLWKISEHVERPAKQVPVVYDVDVAVAGAGVAGVIAALAAARQGADTLIIDEFSSVGGNIGVGLWAGGSFHLGLHYSSPSGLNPDAFPNGIGGIPAEFADRILQGEDRMLGEGYFRDAQAQKAVAVQMLEEAGTKMLLSAFVSDVLMDGNKVCGLLVETKSGTLAVKSKVAIDCTGTADVADRAGAPLIVQPTHPSAGVFFALGHVDYDRYEQALQERSEISENDKAWLEAHAPESEPYMPWVRQAWEAGEFYIVDTVDDFATLEIMLKGPVPSEPTMLRGRTRVNGNWNPGDALALSRINQKMHVYIYAFAQFLQRRVPGFEDSYLHLISSFTHARGGKCIDSEYMVSGDDVNAEKRFNDVVYKYFAPTVNGTDIPYRMMLPKKINGLLAAGKSAMNRGPQFRARYSCQLMGQAAGVAAALATKSGIEPREIDVKQLQKILHELGSNMGPPDRVKELGIT